MTTKPKFYLYLSKCPSSDQLVLLGLCRHLSQICKVAARSPIRTFIKFYQVDIQALAEFSFKRKVRYALANTPVNLFVL